MKGGEEDRRATNNDWKMDRALAGYALEGPQMSIKQMSTQLLSVPMDQQERFIDLQRMRARQVWDEVKHGQLNADVLLRGGLTVFSRSTACHNQDKVSMGVTAARQAREVVNLTQQVEAIHLPILCQAADLRGPEGLGEGSRRVYAAVRKVSAFVDFDRELRGDIEAVVGLIRSGALVAAIETDA